jgi:hypothetical protein
VKEPELAEPNSSLVLAGPVLVLDQKQPVASLRTSLILGTVVLRFWVLPTSQNLAPSLVPLNWNFQLLGCSTHRLVPGSPSGLNENTLDQWRWLVSMCSVNGSL